ncbi:MAG: hypothetical protein KGK16_02285 [Bradyrhizobium sp.]|nr:hypothetical protein [Bradyrhizobium sp.]
MEITQFELEASRDGKFVIFTAGQTDQEPISLSIPCEVIGEMVVGLLSTSTVCAQLNDSASQGFSGVAEQSEGAFALANGIALQDVTDRPDVVALTFLFGQTQVAIGLSRVALQPLGSALLAATADKSKPH